MKILDPRWRINNLYKIVDKSGRLITFTENKPQRIVNEDPSNEKVILKARQIGFSTSRIIRLFDKTIWNKNQTSVILAHENDSIKKLFRIVYRAYKFMDERIKPQLDRGGGSRYEYFFPEINSRIYCDLESRSDTIQNLHISEFGLMKNDDRVRATLDAVPIHGEITYESTPKGLNHFHDKWVSGSGKKFFFPWYSMDEYRIPTEEITYTDEEIELIEKAMKSYGFHLTKEQIAFRRWKIIQKGGGKRGLSAFKEEFPEDDASCFLSSGENVIDLFAVNEMLQNAKAPIYENDWMTIYEEPDKHKFYVCGADVAEGVGGDYSVGVMICPRTRRVVGVIRGQWKPYDFAHRLTEFCRKFRGPGRPFPVLAVERNNHGHAVLLELKEHIGYENLYHREINVDGDLDPSPGWVTNIITRPLMMDAFIYALENKFIHISDKNILAECLTLVNVNGKIEAASGKHDDCVVATAIALQMAINSASADVYEDLKAKIRM